MHGLGTRVEGDDLPRPRPRRVIVMQQSFNKGPCRDELRNQNACSCNSPPHTMLVATRTCCQTQAARLEKRVCTQTHRVAFGGKRWARVWGEGGVATKAFSSSSLLQHKARQVPALDHPKLLEHKARQVPALDHPNFKGRRFAPGSLRDAARPVLP